MSEGMGEIPLEELRRQVTKVPPNFVGHVDAEAEALEPTVISLRTKALGFLQEHKGEPRLLENIGEQRHLDGIVAAMRSIDGGQDFTLHELQKLQPDICWYRGGTLNRWGDSLRPKEAQLYTQEDLDTYVIDGGQNGRLGIPSTALAFLRIANRKEPAFYTLTLDSLINGLERDAIYLTTEHDYDLVVANGNAGHKEYLDFCRKNLKVQKVALDQTSQK